MVGKSPRTLTKANKVLIYFPENCTAQQGTARHTALFLYTVVAQTVQFSGKSTIGMNFQFSFLFLRSIHPSASLIH